jgi:transcriptional regulator with XRE-family HTH domain
MSAPKQTQGSSHVMHRIQKVRESEGVSLSAMARRMKRPMSELQRQEQVDSDLRLSELYRWQSALDVPLSELLATPGYEVSEGIRHRAGLTRVAKTARSLLRNSETDATRCLAETLVEQLVDMMPELKDQGAWHERGVPKPASEAGRVAEHIVDSSWFTLDNDYELL